MPDSSSQIRLSEARLDETSGDIVRLFLSFPIKFGVNGKAHEKQKWEKSTFHLKRESVRDFLLTDENRAVATSELGSNST